MSAHSQKFLELYFPEVCSENKEKQKQNRKLKVF